MEERKKLIEEIVNDIVEIKFQKLCKITCLPEYYKNEFLKHSILHNNSIPCIGRMYAEMLVTCSEQFSYDFIDLKHANRYVTYLKNYCNEEMLTFISNLFTELRGKIYEKYPNSLLLMNFKGRFKGFRSFEAKIRSKLLKLKAIPYLLDNFHIYLKNYQESIHKKDSENPKANFTFSKEDFSYVNFYLENLYSSLEIADPTKDCVGYRAILSNFDHFETDDILIPKIYEIANFSMKFFRNRGYDITEVKDYIKDPKDNNYQSFHFVIIINDIPVEFQLRTEAMHQVAEEGTANYYEIYKDTLLQNSMKDFMYCTSKEMNKIFRHQYIGLLEHILLPRQSILITPNVDIPRTPADLRPFPNLELLEKIYAKSPKFS